MCDVTEELKAGGTDDVCEYMMEHSPRNMPTTDKCSESIAESDSSEICREIVNLFFECVFYWILYPGDG